MSTGVEQRGKPSSSQSGSQAANGASKDDYDYSRAGQGSYAPTMGSSAMSDPYAASSFYPAYLSYPSQGGINEGVWSNGDPMYMGGYGQMNNDMYPGGGLFGGFDYAQMGYSWQYPGSEYSAWNTPSSQQPHRKDDPRGYMTDHYYMGGGGMDAYGTINGSGGGGGGGELADGGVHTVEQGLRNVSVGEKREPASTAVSARESSSTSGGPSASRTTSAQPAKPMTWASVASKSAGLSQQKAPPKIVSRSSVVPTRGHGDSTATGVSTSGSYEGKSSSNSTSGTGARPPSVTTGARTGNAWSGSRAAKPAASMGLSSESRNVSDGPTSSSSRSADALPTSSSSSAARSNNGSSSANHDYNPKDFNLSPKGARFFIIKSYSEDDIHRSIKYRIWCSTDHGNKRLDSAYYERDGKGPVYLFFSVNGSGHFCGMAQMVSPLDYNTSAGVWAQDKWKGRFEVKWIYVKDVPNSQLRHIRLENNENKPVTNSRDTQEVPSEQGKQVLRIVHQYRHTTSIFDDFIHYEKRQEEENAAKKGRREGSDSGAL